MRKFLYQRLINEYNNFLRLSLNNRRLLLSYIFFLISYPFHEIFVNAYLWRQTEGIELLLVYNIFSFVGLPIGFFINGFLLKTFNIKSLYLSGLIIQATTVISLVFFENFNYLNIAIYGMSAGFGSALFWSNRNYLSLIFTERSTRLYSVSLESVSYSVLTITVPVIVGFFITLGPSTGNYSLELAYQISMGLNLILVSISGLIIYLSNIDDLNDPVVLLRNSSKFHNYNRVYLFFSEIFNGIFMFIPTIFILKYAGEENILGSVQSVGALATACIIYLVGRKFKEQSYYKILILSWILMIIGAFLPFIYFQSATLILMLIILNIGSEIKFIVTWSMIMNLVDNEVKDHYELRYAYIADNELFINLGRIAGALILGILWVVFPADVALRYIVPIVVMIQLISLFVARPLLRQHEYST